jgi:guanylate kinase
VTQVRAGIPFVVAAPSGTGKTTVCRAVLARDPGIRFSVSHTTRAPRDGEVDGVDYHFVSAAQFRKLVEQGQFLEHASYAGNLYGTSWQALRTPLAAGFDLLLEIEVQGARQVRERLSTARLVFLLPPSMTILEERLRTRGTDSRDEIEKRLAVADTELAAAELFDYAVVNRDLEQAVDDVLAIIRLERNGKASEAQARFGREAVMSQWQKTARARAGAPSDRR